MSVIPSFVVGCLMR